MENKVIKLEVENKYLREEVEFLKKQLENYRKLATPTTKEIEEDWLKDDFEETKKFFEEKRKLWGLK